MALLMDYTTLGRTRATQLRTSGLKFDITDLAVGTSGYNPGAPTMPLALNPAVTSLTAEVKRVPVHQITVDVPKLPRGQESAYTSINGVGVGNFVGEAGLFATVTDPGSTSLTIGDKFLLMQAHFSRQPLMDETDKVSMRWRYDLHT